MNYITCLGIPRRRELLAKCGIYFDIIPSEIEEKITGEAPPDIVMDLARQKAMDVWKNHAKNGDVVIGADTIVCIPRPKFSVSPRMKSSEYAVDVG